MPTWKSLHTRSAENNLPYIIFCICRCGRMNKLGWGGKVEKGGGWKDFSYLLPHRGVGNEGIYSNERGSFLEISRERRSPAKLSDWTGPTEGTEGRKTDGRTDKKMDGGYIDGMIGRVLAFHLWWKYLRMWVWKLLCWPGCLGERARLLFICALAQSWPCLHSELAHLHRCAELWAVLE